MYAASLLLDKDQKHISEAQKKTQNSLKWESRKLRNSTFNTKINCGHCLNNCSHLCIYNLTRAVTVISIIRKLYLKYLIETESFTDGDLKITIDKRQHVIRQPVNESTLYRAFSCLCTPYPNLLSETHLEPCQVV